VTAPWRLAGSPLKVTLPGQAGSGILRAPSGGETDGSEWCGSRTRGAPQYLPLFDSMCSALLTKV